MVHEPTDRKGLNGEEKQPGSLTDLKLRGLLHHSKGNVTANRMANQHKLHVFRDTLAEEAQLVFNLPLKPKDIVELFKIRT